MGLDNGIILKKSIKEIKIPWYVSVDYRSNNTKVEVCYWRKCWGIRGEILDIFDEQDIMSGGYEYQIKSEHISKIVKVIKKYLNKKYWEENARSIWEYREYFPRNIQNIINLLWLKRYLKENPNVECYFYDSY